MKIERFEDIITWQKAKVLTFGIYKRFGNSKDFGFRDQIQRASVSVMTILQKGLRGNLIKSLNIFSS